MEHRFASRFAAVFHRLRFCSLNMISVSYLPARGNPNRDYGDGCIHSKDDSSFRMAQSVLHSFQAYTVLSANYGFFRSKIFSFGKVCVFPQAALRYIACSDLCTRTLYHSRLYILPSRIRRILFRQSPERLIFLSLFSSVILHLFIVFNGY